MTTEAGGLPGTGGVPAEDDELAGGLTTGGAGFGGSVNERAVSVSAWGISPGRVTIC